MDEKSLPGLLSHLFDDASGKNLDSEGDKANEQNNFLAESLKAIIGQSSGPVGTAVNEFLSGKGELHERTRTAVTSGSSSAVSVIVTFLTTQLNLPPATAKVIAPILVKLLPSIAKQTEKDAAAKKTLRRKAKPKTASNAKKETSSTKRKPKKKTTTKPRTSVSKPKATKKTSSRVVKKKPATAKKPTKAKRTVSIDTSAGDPQSSQE